MIRILAHSVSPFPAVSKLSLFHSLFWAAAGQAYWRKRSGVEGCMGEEPNIQPRNSMVLYKSFNTLLGAVKEVRHVLSWFLFCVHIFWLLRWNFCHFSTVSVSYDFEKIWKPQITRFLFFLHNRVLNQVGYFRSTYLFILQHKFFVRLRLYCSMPELLPNSSRKKYNNPTSESLFCPP